MLVTIIVTLIKIKNIYGKKNSKGYIPYFLPSLTDQLGCPCLRCPCFRKVGALTFDDNPAAILLSPGFEPRTPT